MPVKLFLLSLTFVIISYGQTMMADVSKNNTEAAKLQLAKELAVALEIGKLLKENMLNAERYLQRPPNEKNEQANKLAKKVLDKAKAKYDERKNSISQDANDKVVKQLAQQFSATELKYLIEITKYPLHKKFKNFLESEDYYRLLSQPYTEAQALVAQAKKEQ